MTATIQVHWPRAAVWFGLALYACGGEGVGVNGMCTTSPECERPLFCVDNRCQPEIVASRDSGARDGGTRRDANVRDLALVEVGARDVEADTFNCVDLTLEFTGEPTRVDIPADARFLVVKAWGAGGNGDGGSHGGPGGFTSALFEIDGPTTLTAVVGRLGRHDGIEAFGFGALGGGGLTGIFTGPPPVEAHERDRAVLIAGGGGSAQRNGGSNGGPGNDEGADMPTMAGGNATRITPGRTNEGTGGGGGYEGGRGRNAAGTGGRGGSGYVARRTETLTVALDDEGNEVLTQQTSPNANPPRQDDEDYPDDVRCPPGTTECSGHLTIRALCERPPPGLVI